MATPMPNYGGNAPLLLSPEIFHAHRPPGVFIHAILEP